MGKCRTCGAEVTDKKRSGEFYKICAKCREYFKKYNQERRRQLAKERRCIQCGFPLAEGEYGRCAKCRADQKAASHELHAERTAKGLCHECGAPVREINPSTQKPYTRCAPCREIFNRGYSKHKKR